MRDFQSCLEACCLEDIGYMGGKYTWCNNHREGAIFERLDRAVVDGNWRSLFPSAIVNHDVTTVSDHIPIVVDCLPNAVGGRTNKRFRFEEMCTGHEGLEVVVKQGWEGGRGDVVCKIVGLSFDLTSWDRLVFGSVNRRLKIKHRRLGWLQQQQSSVGLGRRLTT
ncbi:uncharacterized protein LOC119981876 [Tripterygium wilfordii]|uniref:uncharacterized protein LOC119981876 n=1 Tax=Tripterygium wilfordii TaxID=458696 RepID=UPI0018F8446C|nr:uncharacterized protein LOC119981876 [Tripterygium wilfordii]